MELMITVDSPVRAQALQRALAAFNVSNAPLSEQAFLQKLINGQLDGLVKAYLITTITKLDFLNRLTADERIGIRAAAAQSPAIHDYMAMLDAAQDVDLTDARTIGGVQALEAAGLIGEGRAAVILAL